jgi:hypothetical protein
MTPLGLVVLALAPATALAATPVQLQINIAGTTQLIANPAASSIDFLAPFEIDPALFGDDDEDLGGFGLGSSASPAPLLNRSVAQGEGRGGQHEGSEERGGGPEVLLSFDGLNHVDQRLANHGNQFSVEPPDQGLCSGNGFVVETVNDVIRVFDSQGNPLTAPVDLNTFLGYPAAINRTTIPNQFGPEVTDPSCVFDPGSQRFFHVALTLDRVGTTSTLSGKNHLDIAVSNTADPTGTWTIFRLPVQNDGTDGTPNHHCNGPCLGDYPHIGFNRDGIYLTTNEFSLFNSGFFGAQIYALSKAALVSGAASVPVVLFDTVDSPFPGHTVWPAQPSSAGEDGDAEGGGNIEYLMSSLAVFSQTGTSSQILVWSISNTQSLNRTPNLQLNVRPIDVLTYAVPPFSDQRVGDFPLGQCLSDNSIPTPFGVGCWRFIFTAGGPFPNTQKQRIASNDSRMQQVFFSQGKLWGALDTAVSVGGENRAGIAFFVVNPHSGKIVKQGVVAVAGNNVTYPAIGVTRNGRAVIAVTLLGRDHYPSAAYVSIDKNGSAGPVNVVAEGKGPDDGFTGYHPFSQFGTRQRWGDYGAAVAVDNDTVWIASEYIGQTCTLSQYVSSGLSCGLTRTSLANWYTRLTKLELGGD